MNFYINVVEEEISKLLDIIYSKYIAKNIIKDNLIKLKNVTTLNNLFNTYVNEIEKYIDTNKLKKIVNKEDNYLKVKVIIKKYIIYYLILILSFYIKEDEYKNILITLQKSNNNSLFSNDNYAITIINQYNFLKDYLYILNLYNNNRDEFTNVITTNKLKYNSVILFINQEITSDNIKLLIGNDIKSFHNNVFFILIKRLYIKNDIKNIYDLLEDNNNIVYSTIDIVLPLISYIDEELISGVLFKEEKKNYIIKNFFNLLINKQTSLTEDDKINILLEKNIIFPILDDFLRYHKDTEIYEKNSDTKFDKSNTKIKYIISKINQLQNYYIKDKNEQAKLDMLFYKRLIYRKAILYNELEEVNIIRKLYLKGNTAVENNEYINNLLDIRKYAYLNYNTINSEGFPFKFNNTISAVRYSNFEFNNSKFYKIQYNSKIETRVAPKYEKVNVIGLFFSNNDVNNIILKKIEDIKNNNNLNSLIYNFFKDSNKNYYWLFNKKDLKYINLNQKNFNYNSKDNSALCKYIILYIFDIYTLYIYDKIFNLINNMKNATLFKLYKIVDYTQYKTINIHKLLRKNNIENTIYNKVFNFTDKKDLVDNEENIIKGLEGKIIKLPDIIKKKNKISRISFNLLNNKDKDINIFDNPDYICQHEIDYYEINNLKKNDNLYSDKIYNFINKYAYTNNNIFLCKSCNKILNIKKYVVNIHNLSGEEGVNIDINNNIDFKNNDQYKNYLKLIEYIDKLIDRIALITNITIFLGNSNESKFNRKKIIKQVIDVIELNYNLYLKLNKNEKEKKLLNTQSIYNISLNYSKFFIFKLSDDIFKFKSKDDDKYKKRKINNIILYIIFFMLLQLNKNHIINLNEDKLCNIIIFKKYYKIIFENINIKINNTNDISKVLSYPVLCYYLFYISCILLKFKLWQFEDDNTKFDFVKVKIIINSVCDLINHICENNKIIKNNYLFNNIVFLFYLHQKKIYSHHDILKLIEDKQFNKLKYNKIKNVITVIKSDIEPIKISGEMDNLYKFEKLKFLCKSLVFNLKLLPDSSNKKLTDNELNLFYKTLSKNTNNKIIKNYDKNNKIRNIKLTDKQLKDISSNDYDKIINDYYNNKIPNIFLKRIYKEKKKYNIDLDINVLVKFITNLQNIFSNNIYVNKIKINIVSNQFIINHDINGNNILKNIYIMENNKKIINNHNIFKQDVLMLENNKYLMFYNLYNNLYLGFKDNYNTLINKKSKFLRINYSVRNLLLLIGINYKYHYIKNKNIKNYVYNYVKNRNNQIKNIINTFLENINLLKNNTSSKNKIETKYIKNYINNISSINMTTSDNNDIFNKYNIIFDDFEFNDNLTINLINNKYINLVDIIKNSNNDKFFYYFINQLNVLFTLNNNSNNILLFKILINIIYDKFNNNTETFNTLDNLLYEKILMFDNINYFNNIEPTDGIIKEELTEEEQNEINEQKYSEQETNDALDYEVNEDDDSELGEGEELIQDLD